MNKTDFSGLKITIMGLGLHGGGRDTARFLAEQGALLTITDLRSEEILKPSLESLNQYDIRYVLGKHDMNDFTNADIVIKNPAVPADSPYLKAAKRIESDISLFLLLNKNPVYAVTGSKGKSTCVSALHYILQQSGCQSHLGGNITNTPLNFLDKIQKEDPVILELSSWQLGDLKNRNLLSPRCAVFTNLMHDHQNRYNSFEDYIEDKLVIFADQTKDQIAFYPDNERGHSWKNRFNGNAVFFSPKKDPKTENALWLTRDNGFLRYQGNTISLLPSEILIPGEHNRMNLLIASAFAWFHLRDNKKIKEAASRFPGIAHRMETVGEIDGVRFINDTTATIPEAAAAAVCSLNSPVHLIAGGTDKDLDFTGYGPSFVKASSIQLLEGTATDKMMIELKKHGIAWNGPYSNLKKAVDKSRELASSGDIVLLSPGATSFGMFLNEFERGDQFRNYIQELKK